MMWRSEPGGPAFGLTLRDRRSSPDEARIPAVLRGYRRLGMPVRERRFGAGCWHGCGRPPGGGRGQREPGGRRDRLALLAGAGRNAVARLDVVTCGSGA